VTQQFGQRFKAGFTTVMDVLVHAANLVHGARSWCCDHGQQQLCLSRLLFMAEPERKEGCEI
jgi:hypothetical protein